MPYYRRSLIEGGTYFFTVVTFDRAPILESAEARKLLHSAWLNVSNRFPFKTVAVCLLPDHLHCIWSLPEGDSDYSKRWKEVKRLFTREYLLQIGSGGSRNTSRLKRGEAAIWQRRFWEHTIQDEHDLNRHLDYVHYNPVKHGLVRNVSEWLWSSFHRYVRLGYYDASWGGSVGVQSDEMEYGE